MYSPRKSNTDSKPTKFEHKSVYNDRYHKYNHFSYHLNNLGGGGCVGGEAAHTPPIFPYLLRSCHFSLIFSR